MILDLNPSVGRLWTLCMELRGWWGLRSEWLARSANSRSTWRASHSPHALPPPRIERQRALRGNGAGDLTFTLGWLNFPALWVEGSALESRLAMRITRTALAKRTCPPK